MLWRILAYSHVTNSLILTHRAHKFVVAECDGKYDMSAIKRRSDNFASISQVDLPSGRKGKHHLLLVQVIEDLEHLDDGRAMRIPLAEFGGSVADIRAAIFRATKKRKLQVATSSDDEFFYVWKPTKGVSKAS